MWRTCFTDLGAGIPGAWLEVEIPNPALHAGSAVVLLGSLLAVATWSELCSLLFEVLEGFATFADRGSTFGRLCLPLEKKEEECVGIFEIWDAEDAEDAMGGLGDGPTGIFSFDSALPDCFVDLKPNAPREAIVAAWLAKRSNKL